MGQTIYRTCAGLAYKYEINNSYNAFLTEYKETTDEHKLVVLRNNIISLFKQHKTTKSTFNFGAYKMGVCIKISRLKLFYTSYEKYLNKYYEIFSNNLNNDKLLQLLNDEINDISDLFGLYLLAVLML